jgi:hypothetical protein
MDGTMLRVTLVLFLLLASSVAHAEKRVALVIGNSAYKHAGVLPNPMNDAVDMAGILKQKDFLVIEGQDLDKSAFVSKVEEFRRAITRAEIAVFFYAGHGMQVAGQNFLVPTDAELATSAGARQRTGAGKCGLQRDEEWTPLQDRGARCMPQQSVGRALERGGWRSFVDDRPRVGAGGFARLGLSGEFFNATR